MILVLLTEHMILKTYSFHIPQTCTQWHLLQYILLKFILLLFKI